MNNSNATQRDWACFISAGRLYGTALFPVRARVLRIRDTPLTAIEAHAFHGINRTLQELHIERSLLQSFPNAAIQVGDPVPPQRATYLPENSESQTSFTVYCSTKLGQVVSFRSTWIGKKNYLKQLTLVSISFSLTIIS